jgi:hypothetical protein
LRGKILNPALSAPTTLKRNAAKPTNSAPFWVGPRRAAFFQEDASASSAPGGDSQSRVVRMKKKKGRQNGQAATNIRQTTRHEPKVTSDIVNFQFCRDFDRPRHCAVLFQ